MLARTASRGPRAACGGTVGLLARDGPCIAPVGRPANTGGKVIDQIAEFVQGVLEAGTLAQMREQLASRSHVDKEVAKLKKGIEKLTDDFRGLDRLDRKLNDRLDWIKTSFVPFETFWLELEKKAYITDMEAI